MKTAIWDNEATQRFWDFEATRPENYLSFQQAEGLRVFLEATQRLHGRLLDYGCGPGFLLAELMRHHGDLHCYGAEFSADSVQAAQGNLQAFQGWQGAQEVTGFPTPYEENFFDVVTCIEVIEHLTDEWLQPVLEEIYRVLKPGDMAFLSTPNDEKLDDATILCPFCDTGFHRWQHVRAWNAQTLSENLRAQKFEVLWCRGVYLELFSAKSLSPLDWSVRAVGKQAVANIAKGRDRLQPRPFPQTRAFAHMARA